MSIRTKALIATIVAIIILFLVSCESSTEMVKCKILYNDVHIIVEMPKNLYNVGDTVVLDEYISYNSRPKYCENPPLFEKNIYWFDNSKFFYYKAVIIK